MHPADIKAAIAKAGYTYDGLLARMKTPAGEKSTSAVSQVVRGRSRSRIIESLISETTGIPPQELWPQWYPPKTRNAA